MKKALVLYFINFLCVFGQAQVSSGLFRFPDVSQTQIVFTYANDLWIAPREGGNAHKLSSPLGVESFPKFSKDGTKIAYTANYDGNSDVYLLSVEGGIPKRITQHGMSDRVVDWTPNGDRILFASGRESEKERYNQLYTISSSGGPTEKLPLAYGEFASYSPDGNKLAVVFRSEIFRTWKRYRGGDVADIYIYDFKTNTSQNISSQIDAGEELPMWHENSIYFLTDNGPEKRMNLWKYDMITKNRSQLTHFKNSDILFPSLGPSDIIFNAEGKLYLYNLMAGNLKEIKVNMILDKAVLKPSIEKAEKYIQNLALSPDGNRVLIEARGDIFSVPAENGFIKNLTRSSGTAERYPSWSPDGKKIAYWSDQSGEYELWIQSNETNKAAVKMTNYGPGYRYQSFWSPDSKKLAFIDKAMKIKIIDLEKNTTLDVDKALSWSHGPLNSFTVNWSSDSRWLAYFRDLENWHNAVFIYDLEHGKTEQITSGYYDCSYPVFSPDGKFIFLLTNQNFSPSYSDIDNTFIYANSTQIGAIALMKNTNSILTPKNDTVEIKKEEPMTSKSEDKNKMNKKTSEKKDSTEKKQNIEIDFSNIESRMVILPISAGNYFNLSSLQDKIIYQKFPNTGSSNDNKPSIKYYDINTREEKTILEDVQWYSISFNQKKLLVSRSGSFAIIKPEENQKFEKPLRVSELETNTDPIPEWRQIFMDAWRLERDYFYDPNLHGVNWNDIKTFYLNLLESAISREDVNFILGEMIGELNSSHTYRGGGREEQSKRLSVGYLGVNWMAENGFYKIKNIIRPAPWDAEIRSPLDGPGIDIKEGDFILAVNGQAINTSEEPYSFFQGLAGTTIELTYNSTPSWTNAKTAIVKTLESESRLRHLSWIESNRIKVDSATHGEVGYIYVRSTGTDGQSELIRQFSAQWNKKALIIDERFNNGGQIPDRFIEILNREPLAFWAIRDGNTWPWPPFANFGPKVMLINGWSGSGGDAFPDYFRKKKLGPLIGARTWGGLIGISGVPSLIDGGTITVPTFRMYNPDGTWFKEGHGVDPDIEVQEDLGEMSRGNDVQLSRAIIEIKELLKLNKFIQPSRPPAEIR